MTDIKWDTLTEQLQAQDFLNRSSAHLIAQGEKAMSAVGATCMYRALAGRRCAIGALMPDEKYRPDFEGVGVVSAHAPMMAADIRRAIGVEHDSFMMNLFLKALQDVHDFSEPEEWAKRIMVVAEHYGLDVPKVVTQ